MSVKTLKAKDVLEMVAIRATSLEDKNGETYYRANIAGRGGILREDVVNAIQKGDCATLSYQETEIDAVDPETGEPTGEKKQTFTYLNHSTFTQVKNVAKNERDLKEIEEGIQVNDEFVANLAAKLKAANINTEAEILQ